MPKGFTEKEKTHIRKRLMSEGMKLFDKYGIQKTSIDDIINAVGISKGSFYSFFSSKEELFFEILEDIEKQYKSAFYTDVFNDGKPYESSFRDFLKSFFAFMETTPLFRKIDQNSVEYLYRKLPEERIAGHLQRDEDTVLNFVDESQKKGIFKGLNPLAFSGVLKMFFFLIIRKEEFQNDEFEATKELLIDMLVEYLFNKKRS